MLTNMRGIRVLVGAMAEGVVVSPNPVTVRLERGDGAGWQAYRSTDTQRLAVFVRCPWCDEVVSLGQNTVNAAGMALAAIRCSHPGCLHIPFRVFLEGWTFNVVHHPPVLAPAVAQADGAGC